MQCRELRELLDSYLAEELLVETNHEVLRHLDGCSECRAELEARTRLRAGLRKALAGAPSLQMRPEFREEMAARLRGGTPVPGAAPRRRRLPYGWLALAASLAIVAGAVAYVSRGAGAPAVAVQAAGDHQNCAIKFALAERPISLQDAAARFDPALAGMETVPPDDLPTPAGLLHVAERHSCVFESRRFGHVVLKIDGHVVSLLMTADLEHDDIPSRDHELAWLPPVNGMSIASLHVPGHTVFVVSDMPDESFRQVAASLANPASTLGALLGNISAAFGD